MEVILVELSGLTDAQLAELETAVEARHSEVCRLLLDVPTGTATMATLIEQRRICETLLSEIADHRRALRHTDPRGEPSEG